VRSAPDLLVSAAGEDPFDMLATGVGHRFVGKNPDAIALMRGSEVSCSHNSPACAIPHVGKITEDHGKTSSHKHW
jgi:hypothetical protein